MGPECPKCGARMVSRKQGETGRRFWGCSNFPTCRGTRDTDGNAPGERARETRRDHDDDEEMPRRDDRPRSRRYEGFGR